MGLNNREYKELERLKHKAELSKLSHADNKRLIKLEGVDCNGQLLYYWFYKLDTTRGVLKCQNRNTLRL